MRATANGSSRIRVIALACLGLASCCAEAVEMYRWVDERGVTNISDAVPERYRSTATRVDSSQFSVPEAQRREADARRASLISKAEATGRPASAAAQFGGARATGTASAPAQLPAPVDCATLQRRYAQAQDCFQAGPKNQNGTINAAKSPACPIVVDPSPQCGVPVVTPR